MGPESQNFSQWHSKKAIKGIPPRSFQFAYVCMCVFSAGERGYCLYFHFFFFFSNLLLVNFRHKNQDSIGSLQSKCGRKDFSNLEFWNAFIKLMTLSSFLSFAVNYEFHFACREIFL